MTGQQPIASPITEIDARYHVVVIGSGYGASVAASRLARAGQTVCVLERGREILRGDYPDTFEEAHDQLQWSTREHHHGDRRALFSAHLDHEINVLSGCGLGGTSLINANVSLEADPRVFDRGWPQALRDDVDHGLAEGIARARAMLGANPLPATESPAKLAALEHAAAALDLEAHRPDLNVTFTATRNRAGVEQPGCTGCGDCVTGCNVGAKNSLLMNYLPDAVAHGARIFTEVDVRTIEREGAHWAVRYRPLDTDRRPGSPDLLVLADIVVLGAGVLGSTEILLRSRDEQHLAVSHALGSHFSGNGDILGFTYAGTERVHGVGHGEHPAAGRPWIGPTITGVVDVRADDLEDSFIIEEGAVPGAIAKIVGPAFSVAATLQRVHADVDDRLSVGAYDGPVDRSTTFLVMGHDDAKGSITLDDDHVRIDWPGAGGQQNVKRANDALRVASQTLGGRFVENPTWAADQDQPLVTVHPLGGCPMGETAHEGVVDERGRVFAGTTGTETHPGLYVMDASVIPRSLGVNPLLTITGLAERACALLAADHGWTIPYDGSTPVPIPEPPLPSLQFTERMVGWIAPAAGPGAIPDAYAAAATAGEQAGTPCEFELTIVADDVVRFIDDPARPAVALGTVTAPVLDTEPLTVTEGVFELFEPEDQPDTQHMVYRLRLTRDDDEREWFLSGIKVIDRGRLRDLWHDTTTLYVDVHEGPDESGPVRYRGVLRIELDDFAHQLRTMRVDDAQSEAQRLRLLARFGAMFAGNLWDHYGGIFGGLRALDPHAPPRAKRPLVCGVPTVYAFETEDHVELQLLRYRGGDRGPVVLVHGMGACSGLFTTDTIDTNLTEYLWKEGFDVWLLDWRGSILLDASDALFDADECAKYDYPAASRKIREVTGADGAHWIVHCVGSITFFMSLLGGLEDVKSVVGLQVATHTIPPLMTKIKCGLHVPGVLRALGMRALSAETYGEGFADRAFNQALRLTPLPEGERCSSAVCLRCTFLYSLCWRHTNLTTATHDAIHEMMGVANLEMMEHLAECASHGRLIDKEGRDVYLPHFDRLSMPITLIYGADNQVWEREATETTYRALVERFGPDDYRWHVIDGYGHLDTVFGKHAARDTYPKMLDHLDRAGA